MNRALDKTGYVTIRFRVVVKLLAYRFSGLIDMM